MSQQDAASQITSADTCMTPMSLSESEQVARNVPFHAHVTGFKPSAPARLVVGCSWHMVGSQ